MKRWLVILLIAVAVIVLLSPGIIGRLAQENIDAELARIDLENDNIRIQSESFTRGWFTSEGRHRVALDGGAADLVGSRHADERSPALVIDTRLDHGLLPVTSMQRERGSLAPGLANAVSTLQIDRGEGELVSLPGRIYSFFGLDGESSFRFLMEAGSDRSGSVTTRWQGADIVYAESADGTRRRIDGTIEPGTVIDVVDVVTTIGAARIAGHIDRGEHRFGTGAFSFDLESVVVESPDAEPVAVGPIGIALEQQVRDGRASGTVHTDFKGSGMPDLGELTASVDIAFSGLDADTLVIMKDTWSAMNGIVARRTETEPAAMYPVLIRQLQSLAARGGRLDIREVRVALPEGDWVLTLDLDVPEADGPSTDNWATTALQSSARLTARLSSGLFDHLAAANPDVQAAVAGGFLVRRGDQYEIEARFENGKLTINGAPFPIDAFLGAPR